MVIPADSHVHSEWSSDFRSGRESMERACARAAQMGLPAAAFTEHLDLLAWQVEPADFEGVEQFRAFQTVHSPRRHLTSVRTWSPSTAAAADSPT